MLTQWGTWIDNSLFYFAHFNDLMTFIDGLRPIITARIQQAKKSFARETVWGDLELNKQVSGL
jgi:hypothetical protein